MRLLCARSRTMGGMRRILHGVVACVLAAGVLAPVFAVTSASASAAPLKIMALGDSITAGWDSMKVATVGGYRADLYQRLVADGRAVQFVGDRGTPGAPHRLAGQGRHQGESGKRIDEITGIVAGPLDTWQPDAILLHAGTNDLQQGATPAQAGERLRALLSTVWQRAPRAHVYLASIIPSQRIAARDAARGDGRNYRIEYNDLIRALVPQLREAGRPIDYVHMGPVLSLAKPSGSYVDYVADGIHPNNGGYSKMAVRWHSALASRAIDRWEAEAASTTLHRATRIANNRASAGGRVGYVDYPDSHVSMTVTVAQAGAYRLFVRADNGHTTSCTHALRVNGAAAGALTYPSYDDGDPVYDASGRQLNDADSDTAGDWDQWAVVAADVTLSAGANAIRFEKGACTAEVDAVDVMRR